MAVTCFLLLGSLGLAITAQAQDCARPVPGPNMVLRGGDILLTAFPEGTKVGFTCEVGYTAAGGSSVSNCVAGTWSSVSLQCEKKTCGSLGNLLNGDFDYPDGIEFGSSAVAHCNPGFKLVGRDKIRCGDQGWMDKVPVCHDVTCDPPKPITNGGFDPDKEAFRYREVVLYSCKPSYTLNGSESSECLEDGKLKPPPPTCVSVKCELTDIENAFWKGGSRPPYGHKATVTHECKSGYKMIGKSTSQCGIDSKWTPELLKCEAKNCTKPDGQPTMSLKDKDSVTFRHGTTVTFLCDDGYEPEGSGVITCKTGSWSELKLTCKKTPSTTKSPITKVTGGEGMGKEGDDGDKKPDNGGNVPGLVVGLVVGGLLLFGLCGFAICRYSKKKNNGSVNPDKETANDTEEPILLQNSKHSSAPDPALETSLNMKSP